MASNQFSVLASSRAQGGPSTSSNATGSTTQPSKKKHRAGRKHKKARRKSFAAPSADLESEGLPPASRTGHRAGLYMNERNMSNTSIDSEALLDHREHQYPRLRRPSTLAASLQLPQSSRSRIGLGGQSRDYDEEEDNTESAPLLSTSSRQDVSSSRGYGSSEGRRRHDRSPSRPTSSKSGRKSQLLPMTPSDRYNINYPPSMPGTPPLGPTDRLDLSFGDIMMRDELVETGSHTNSAPETDIDPLLDQSPFERRHTIALQAQEDVCFPQEGMSELAEEDAQQIRDSRSARTRRRRRNKWPDLSILEEWSRLEKEDRSEERRMKKITEPQLVNGRLRPIHKGWYRIEEDAPYRFTYFNEEFQSTIHSQTISELVQPDVGFKELFIPEPPILSDSSDDEEDEPIIQLSNSFRNGASTTGGSRQTSLTPNVAMSEPNIDTTPKPHTTPSGGSSREHSGDPSPMRVKSPLAGLKSPPSNGQKQPRFGERPVWWLDVLSPTEAEMKVLSKTFGIHPLTAEDIMLQEQREKVELFRHYYFVNYRSFDQDAESENHLEPVNMYVVVFREGVISFHFSQTPHPANVRRRVRQLKDFMILSADWVSYAIIDDITDVYLPLIQTIEDEVDAIDDRILQLHSDPSLSSSDKKKNLDNEKGNPDTNVESGGDMLRRVGDCRKKVMSLYRLLGNKADVIKGFAKRCNEHWEVAPRSEIGLYLGDIQDHIVTMTANLSHYEMILARCHANYIAQINIHMNERQEQTADVLGKLTVLGTIVLPMNIITGLWGMNVWVPGQEYEGDLKWFFAITTGLIIFGLGCFIIAKRVYNIV
ncbi:cora-domain-containing protein [Annulohypoxylon maeteangense]|uniref:cora-domain-containing protein n=1 Tax=Annulohypoxylon maeteangense TaxID=1927788 RepID=UPI0020072851|nr:cora-domain-containing protein [Annulohypoxylon maeteangense]KAI0890704.1 cora-domain-containing protein [Annulohypoxylon maeteangense]